MPSCWSAEIAVRVARYQGRIDGYRNDLGAYHIQHLRELVAPSFADSALDVICSILWVEPTRGSRRGHRPGLHGGQLTPDNTGAACKHEGPAAGHQRRARPISLAGRPSRTASLVPGAVHKILPGTGHACCLVTRPGFIGW